MCLTYYSSVGRAVVCAASLIGLGLNPIMSHDVASAMVRRIPIMLMPPIFHELNACVYVDIRVRNPTGKLC